MTKNEIFKKLDQIKTLKKLIEEDCYMSKEICKLLEIEYVEKHRRAITQYIKNNNIVYPYPNHNDINSRIILKYNFFINTWWEHKELSNAILYKLKNQLVINYPEENGINGRYVINIHGHPRSSSVNQVKAHIILWEYYNKKLFPKNYVLVPNDGNFLNLNIDNFKIMSNEDYRSIVASGKRNHFYTTGSTQGICYKGGWKAISKKFRQSHNKCLICGESNKYLLVVHHIISYYLFDKPKDAHFEDNLVCLCNTCHAKLHSKSIKLLGFLPEKVKLNLLELLGTLYEKFKNDDKKLLVDFSIESISSQADLSEGSTTISKESTLQANGNGSGKLLTHNGEDEDIV